MDDPLRDALVAAFNDSPRAVRHTTLLERVVESGIATTPRRVLEALADNDTFKNCSQGWFRLRSHCGRDEAQRRTKRVGLRKQLIAALKENERLREALARASLPDAARKETT